MQKQPTPNEVTTAQEALADKKAQDIVCIPLKGKSSMAEAFIIATGTSRPHVLALAEHTTKMLKQNGAQILSIEGEAEAEWVLVDTGDIIVHIFQQEAREHYRLEKLWLHTLEENKNEENEATTEDPQLQSR